MQITRIARQIFRPNRLSGTKSFQSAVSVSKALPILAVGTGLAYGGILYAEEAKVDYDSVRKDIANIIHDDEWDDGSYGPIFVRLAWHASGTYDKTDNTGGSNGATMRFEPESKWEANAGLHGARDKLEEVKKKYPGLSYADLWTLAAVVAIEEMNGPKVPWRPGRIDYQDGSKIVPDGRLPDGDKGAHALGRCHKQHSGWEGPWTRAPTTFSNELFRELFESDWHVKKHDGPPTFTDPKEEIIMLPADMCIIEDPSFKKWAEVYYKDEKRFFKDFSAAFQKLSELGCKFDEEDSFTPFVSLLGLIGFALYRGC